MAGAGSGGRMKRQPELSRRFGSQHRGTVAHGGDSVELLPASASREPVMWSKRTGMARSAQGSSSTWQRSVASVSSAPMAQRRIRKHADLVAGGRGEEKKTLRH